MSLCAVVLFAGVQLSAAQQNSGNKRTPEKMFASLDADEDGMVTLEEFKSKKRKNEVPVERLEKMFKRMDANADGTLTLEEYQKAMEKRKEQAQKMKKRKEAENESED
ncbi:EF-hand domain-containing protein [Gaetbulibacter saemankumensis]|uniref:EF-hand domain-containing protein n=1 Tax=Gaetbulibacter saemankumensis TaxID=311208 RepID=UPI00040BEA43|nr:EF-hand domain-containing protein [Gaetbulibacter saemankumensis]